MLRFDIVQHGDAYRIDLHGTLGGPWVPLLEQHWRSIPRSNGTQPRVTVVVSDVDFIDADGERLLARMADARVTFVVSGCMNRYVVEKLKEHAHAM